MMPEETVRKPRRWELLRAGFTNWPLPAALAFLDYRSNRLWPGRITAIGNLRCQLRARDGARLVARVRDVNAPAEVFGRDEYGHAGIDWSRVEYVLDLGGHVGSFTLWAAERSPARFFVVEPNPAVFELLERNVRALGERVTLKQAAVAGEAGEGWFAQDIDSASSRLTVAEPTGGLRVRTVSLAQVFAESGFPRVDLVKMDVEGAEYPALRAAEADLLRAARHWVIECHPGADGDADDVAGLFEAAGFETVVAVKPDRLALVTANRRD
ncbi:MAG TPA: FkbM family methyltransferase [Candidatus Dormibacteraeota bacterium]|nr:FkbM family methyltransferase [Candidatus Dormibacteraeota bacterium]